MKYEKRNRKDFLISIHVNMQNHELDAIISVFVLNIIIMLIKVVNLQLGSISQKML